MGASGPIHPAIVVVVVGAMVEVVVDVSEVVVVA